jgi:hypothetical protein
MKLKSFVGLLVLAVLGVFLSACSPIRSGFVALPDTLKADITAVVLVAFSWLLAKLIAMVPAFKFLEEFRVPLALAIASQLIGFIETATPDAFGNVVIIALQLVLAILALVFAGDRLKKQGYKFL